MNIELKALPVYDDRFIKNKITYGDNVYINFPSLIMPEDDAKCEFFESFLLILLVYEKKYYPQVYLDKCAYTIVKMHVMDYLDDNLLSLISFFDFDKWAS